MGCLKIEAAASVSQQVQKNNPPAKAGGASGLLARTVTKFK
jgi:hypothetical protein